ACFEATRLPVSSHRPIVSTRRDGGTISRYVPVTQQLPQLGLRMQEMNRPPTQTLISLYSIVQPLGAYQRTRCCGSVHALKTISRGALKTLVISTSALFSPPCKRGGAGGGVSFVAMILFLIISQ